MTLLANVASVNEELQGLSASLHTGALQKDAVLKDAVLSLSQCRLGLCSYAIQPPCVASGAAAAPSAVCRFKAPDVCAVPVRVCLLAQASM